MNITELSDPARLYALTTQAVGPGRYLAVSEAGQQLLLDTFAFTRTEPINPAMPLVLLGVPVLVVPDIADHQIEMRHRKPSRMGADLRGITPRSGPTHDPQAYLRVRR